jgi:hypothetical protein
MSGFSVDWLRMRAPFDRAARDAPLAAGFARALRRDPGRALRLVDFGAGTGGNARILAPLIGGDQEWLLIDDDPAVLGWQATETLAWAAREGHTAEKSGDGVLVHAQDARWLLRPQRVDLARELATVLKRGCDGITMAALVDLASAAWIDALAGELERCPVPLLSALAVDGRRQWRPPAPEDPPLYQAFAEHQKRDKGFGPALGPAASLYLTAALAARGFTIASAASDWRVGPDDQSMQVALIEAEATAACEARPDLAGEARRWRVRRQAESGAGVLSITIGHRDVLALPHQI